MRLLEHLFRWTGRGVALGTLVAAPWLLGGVYVSTQYWLGIGIAISLVFALLADLMTVRSRWRVPMIVWPVLVTLFIGFMQLVPLNDKTMASISPWTSEWDRQLRSEHTDEDHLLVETLSLPELEPTRPLSIYPAETRRGLAFFALAAGALIASVSLFRTRKSLLALMITVGSNSFAVSIVAIIQKLTWDGAILWCIPTTRGDDSFCMGPFVNRNNGAGFLLIGLGCMLGWLLYSLVKSGALQLRSSRPSVDRYHSSWQDRIGALHAGHFTLFLMTGVVIAGILCSVSRGGNLSMCCAVAAVTTTIALLTRKALLASVMPLVFITGVFLLFWVGWNDQLSQRLETLTESDIMSEDTNWRLMNWSDALQVVPETPWLGSGLFSYRWAYRPYQQQYTYFQFFHAENFYVQTIVETGVVGAMLLLTAIGLSWFYLVRLLRSQDETLCIVGLAGLFIVVSQLLASCFDFGMHIPANLLTLSLFIGGLSALSVNNRSDVDRPPVDKIPRWRVAMDSVYRLALPLLGSAVLLAAVVELKHVVIADQSQFAVQPLVDAIHRVKSPQDDPQGDVSDAELEQGLESLRRALDVRPDDALLHEQVAVLLLEQYRRLQKNETSSSLTLFQWTQLYNRMGLAGELQQLRQDPDLQKYVYPAMRHAILARRACPLFQKPHLLIAQLSGLISPGDGYQRHADRAVAAYPADADVEFLVGLLHQIAGQPDQAAKSWRHCLKLTPARLSDIIPLADPDHQMTPEQIDMLYPDSAKVLMTLARNAYQENEPARKHLLQRAFDALDNEERMPPEQVAYTRYSIRLAQQRPDEAIGHLQEALLLAPSNIAWRYQLALLLRDHGRIEAAQREAKRCMRAEPGNKRYEDLLRELNRTELIGETD